MMLLVRLIDLFVIAVKILGGRTPAHPAVRAFVWFDFLCLLALGVGLLVFLGALGAHYVHTLAGS